MKHSPGPWHEEEEEDHGDMDLEIIDARGRRIVTVENANGIQGDGSSDPKEADQRHADARLIAAAPDLLEALESFMRTVEVYGTTALHTHEPFHRARSAIRKARGLA